MQVALTVKLCGVARPELFPFIDNPGPKSLEIACQSLAKMGALDEEGKVTNIGRAINEFPLDPYSAFCLYNIVSEPETLQRDVVTIIAIINSDGFYEPVGKEFGRREAEHRRQFTVPNSDHLTKLAVFYKFVEAQNKREFCKHFGLKRKSLDNIVLVRDQLLSILEKVTAAVREGRWGGSQKAVLKNKSAGELLGAIRTNFSVDRKRVLFLLKQSFFTRTAELVGFGEYRLRNSHLKVKIHPESVLFSSQSRPSEVVFNTLVSTSRLYISNVSAVI